MCLRTRVVMREYTRSTSICLYIYSIQQYTMEPLYKDIHELWILLQTEHFILCSKAKCQSHYSTGGII